MKLLSLNLALFEKNNYIIQRYLNNHTFDMACFQEVTFASDDKVNREYITAPVVGSQKHTSQFFSPIAVLKDFHVPSFHKKDDFKAEFGGFLEIGLLSSCNYPIKHASTQYVQGTHSLITDWSNWPISDIKGFQSVIVEMNGKPIKIINYHGVWSKDKLDSDLAYSACQKILDEAQKDNLPVIIVGDFNLYPETESIKLLSSRFESLVDTYDIETTRPQDNELSDKKRNVVDYIFVSEDISVNDFTVVQERISDHLALVLDFDL